MDPGPSAEGAGAGVREAEADGVGFEPADAGVEGRRLGKLLSPDRRRCAVDGLPSATAPLLRF